MIIYSNVSGGELSLRDPSGIPVNIPRDGSFVGKNDYYMQYCAMGVLHPFKSGNVDAYCPIKVKRFTLTEDTAVSTTEKIGTSAHNVMIKAISGKVGVWINKSPAVGDTIDDADIVIEAGDIYRTTESNYAYVDKFYVMMGAVGETGKASASVEVSAYHYGTHNDLVDFTKRVVAIYTDNSGLTVSTTKGAKITDAVPSGNFPCRVPTFVIYDVVEDNDIVISCTNAIDINKKEIQIAARYGIQNYLYSTTTRDASSYTETIAIPATRSQAFEVYTQSKEYRLFPVNFISNGIYADSTTEAQTIPNVIKTSTGMLYVKDNSFSELNDDDDLEFYNNASGNVYFLPQRGFSYGDIIYNSDCYTAQWDSMYATNSMIFEPKKVSKITICYSYEDNNNITNKFLALRGFANMFDNEYMLIKQGTTIGDPNGEFIVTKGETLVDNYKYYCTTNVSEATITKDGESTFLNIDKLRRDCLVTVKDAIAIKVTFDDINATADCAVGEHTCYNFLFDADGRETATIYFYDSTIQKAVIAINSARTFDFTDTDYIKFNKENNTITITGLTESKTVNLKMTCAAPNVSIDGAAAVQLFEDSDCKITANNLYIGSTQNTFYFKNTGTLQVEAGETDVTLTQVDDETYSIELYPSNASVLLKELFHAPAVTIDGVSTSLFKDSGLSIQVTSETTFKKTDENKLYFTSDKTLGLLDGTNYVTTGLTESSDVYTLDFTPGVTSIALYEVNPIGVTVNAVPMKIYSDKTYTTLAPNYTLKSQNGITVYFQYEGAITGTTSSNNADHSITFDPNDGIKALMPV